MLQGIQGHPVHIVETLQKASSLLACSVHNSCCVRRKEGRFTHPWQPARLIGRNSVWVRCVRRACCATAALGGILRHKGSTHSLTPNGLTGVVDSMVSAYKRQAGTRTQISGM